MKTKKEYITFLRIILFIVMLASLLFCPVSFNLIKIGEEKKLFMTSIFMVINNPIREFNGGTIYFGLVDFLVNIVVTFLIISFFVSLNKKTYWFSIILVLVTIILAIYCNLSGFTININPVIYNNGQTYPSPFMLIPIGICIFMIVLNGKTIFKNN